MLLLRLAPLILALLLAACEDGGTDDPPPFSEADVEAYRTEAMARLREVDTDLAALERLALAAADSVGQQAIYGRLRDLRARRRAIQDDLDTLQATSADALAAARNALAPTLAALDRETDLTQLDLARGVEEFRAAAAREVEELDREIERLRPEPGRGSTDVWDVVEREREVLGQARARLDAATAEAFGDARRAFIRAFESVSNALDAVRRSEMQIGANSIDQTP